MPISYIRSLVGLRPPGIHPCAPSGRLQSCNQSGPHGHPPAAPPSRFATSVVGRTCHLADKAANVRRCLRPATARSGFPAPVGSEAGAVPAHQRLRPYNLQGVQHPGSQAIEPNKQQAVDAVRATRFGDLRRRTLSWCRSTRTSASNAARDRNSPIKAHQINLQRSPIERTINRFAGVSQLFWVCGRDTRSARPRL
jgi:hypothetical protein